MSDSRSRGLLKRNYFCDDTRVLGFIVALWYAINKLCRLNSLPSYLITQYRADSTAVSAGSTPYAYLHTRCMLPAYEISCIAIVFRSHTHITVVFTHINGMPTVTGLLVKLTNQIREQ